MNGPPESAALAVGDDWWAIGGERQMWRSAERSVYTQFAVGSPVRERCVERFDVELST